MLNFREKRKLKKILYSKFTILVLAIVLAFLANAVWEVYKKARVAYDSKNRVFEKRNELQERETALLSNIENLKTDRGIESEIREKFGVVRDGEEVVVIVDPSGDVTENGNKRAGVSVGLWQKFIGLFKRN